MNSTYDLIAKEDAHHQKIKPHIFFLTYYVKRQPYKTRCRKKIWGQ
jgi:hypothetical protein